MKKIRLDQRVFDLGLAESRERAKTTVMAGIVYVNGQKADKPGMQVDIDADIEVRGNALPFVSRGGYKLDKALKSFEINPSGMVCIDCGASTGGFTDVLLQNGASKVYSVDVGYGQLAWKLRQDPRVINLERTNVRYLTDEIIPEQIDLAVMDASFISIKLLIPPVLKLLKPGSDFICLIKPQFEAGKEEVGKKGVVRDPAVHIKVIEDILCFLKENNICIKALDYSPVKGPEGNIEYLCLINNSGYTGTENISVKETVMKAHEELK